MAIYVQYIGRQGMYINPDGRYLLVPEGIALRLILWGAKRVVVFITALFSLGEVGVFS